MPLAGVAVAVVGPAGTSNYTTDASGQISVEKAAGTYHINLTKTGYETFGVEAQMLEPCPPTPAGMAPRFFYMKATS